ncbi:hypothetical protein, partial [Vibrio sp. S512-13]|uniref:hypothetical protein n=1 Tax=Vibrio sp. S512-13 TaxID=1620394 RepID=UPI001E51B95B
PSCNWGLRHNQNRQETIMSEEQYSKFRNATLPELLNFEAHDVIEWLKGQGDFMGEAVAKQCYQHLARQ